MKNVFKISSSALPDSTLVVGFRGTEGISKLYAFELYLVIPSDGGQEIDPPDAVGAKATLTVDRDDGRPPFVFHGMFAEVGLIHEFGGRALCRCTLVPQVWQLSLSLHSRIFTDKGIPDILEEVLEDAGFTGDDYVLKLSRAYPRQEHVCQYQESDLDFISRWMEREGMYYFFEHGEGQEKLIITDTKSFQDALVPDPVRFSSLAGTDVTAKESVQTFTSRHRSVPARVRVKDYDYAKPTLDVSGTARVSKAGMGEISIYGGRFFTPEEGKRLAKLRAEEILAREALFQGAGTALYLRAGYLSKLQDHPRASFDAKYLAIEVEHYGNQAASTPELKHLTGLDREDVYRVEVTAIPEKVQFRAERSTPWPRVYGFENGVIDGPADSEYAQIDDQGRYAVKFMFDESELRDGKASTWVRMLQPHGGTIEGWHFPLRKGTEVLLTFLGGDPDRPVIAGAVPNARTPSPVTRGNHTTNVIQTGGRNRIEIEDRAGQERITVSTPHANTYLRMGAPNAQHELIVHTDKDALLDTGKRWDIHVGGILSEVVDGDVWESYKGAKNEEVPSGQVAEIYKGQSTTVHTVRHQEYAQQNKLVKGLFKEKIGIHNVTITGGGRTEQITGGLEQTVSGGPGAVQDVSGDKTTKVSGNWIQTIHGKVLQQVLGVSQHFRMDNHVSLTVGATSDTLIGVKNANFIGGQVSLTVGQMVSIKASGELSLSIGAAVAVDAALKMTLTPLSIKLANARIGSIAAVDMTNSPMVLTCAGAMIIS